MSECWGYLFCSVSIVLAASMVFPTPGLPNTHSIGACSCSQAWNIASSLIQSPVPFVSFSMFAACSRAISSVVLVLNESMRLLSSASLKCLCLSRSCRASTSSIPALTTLTLLRVSLVVICTSFTLPYVSAITRLVRSQYTFGAYQ